MYVGKAGFHFYAMCSAGSSTQSPLFTVMFTVAVPDSLICFCGVIAVPVNGCAKYTLSPLATDIVSHFFTAIGLKMYHSCTCPVPGDRGHKAGYILGRMSNCHGTHWRKHGTVIEINCWTV